MVHSKLKKQQLVDHARAIVANEWLTKVELEEIKRQIVIDRMKGSSEDREEHEESNQGGETSD